MKAQIVSDGTEEPAFEYVRIPILFDDHKVLMIWDSIVAVHGLGGDPWETWTHTKTKTCWIRDFLPHDCKRARIITFGYDSALIAESLVQNIQNLAKQLMRHLDALRADCPVCYHTALSSNSVQFLTVYLVSPPSFCCSLSWWYFG